ncbi:MAG: hypothetical protein K9G67_14645 [Bacteroidales bacterium]|nr:hypothetical protein [Bacteroidales bacterium]MCF8377591.1 hypothetical protein [Bacteroidales bacterium]MCF8401828.1 hypothetical protein [Bacteroidales bacterium]
MTQEEIEKIIKSTVHIVMSEPKTLLPKGLGSGCIVKFNDKELLFTVAHVTDIQAATCIVTGHPPVMNHTPMYSVGGMWFLDKFDITKYEEQIEIIKSDPDRIEDRDFGQIDFSFATLKHKIEYLQNEIKFKDFTVEKEKKEVIPITLTEVPDENSHYGFFGRIKAKWLMNNSNPVLASQEVFYGGLKFKRKVGHYYEFALPEEIKSHTDFQGTSGAPIMDTNGKLVSLITHGYEGADRIYGIALADFKSGIEAMIMTEEK